MNQAASMPGKTLEQLTLTELRRECERYGIVSSGTKADLEVQLSEHNRELGSDPRSTRFISQEPDEQHEGGAETDQNIEGRENGEDAFGIQDRLLPTLGAQPSLEERISTLESCMRHYFDDQRRIAESMRRIDLGMRPSKSGPILRPSHIHTQPIIDTRVTDEDQERDAQGNRTEMPSPVPPSLHTTPTRSCDGTQSHRTAHGETGRPRTSTYSVRFDQTREPVADSTRYYGPQTQRAETSRSYSGQPLNTVHMFEHSVLIPYEDLRTARASLPEFAGTRAEDPVRFLENTESILSQANIHPSGWTKAVEPQLKGAALIWWKSIKVLDLSWLEFRTEFLENFDNPEIQTQLRVSIVSSRQTPTQSLTDFVLNKNQLARRVNTGLTETQLVGIIAGLTRDEFRVHVRLQHPTTFADLRRITGVLDPPISVTGRTAKAEITRKTTSEGNREATNITRQYTRNYTTTRRSRGTPPSACRFCGGDHWHSDCPEKPTMSGNGGGVSGA